MEEKKQNNRKVVKIDGKWFVATMIETKIKEPAWHKYSISAKQKEQILAAVKARMESCVTNLEKNLDRVYKVTEYGIWYVQENGIQHHFSNPAYEAMEQVKKMLETSFEISQLTSGQYLQLIKAVAMAQDIDDKEMILNLLTEYYAMSLNQ